MDKAAESVVTLLVLQSDAYDWKKIFDGTRLQDGTIIQVIQVGWNEILVSADSPPRAANSKSSCLVHCRNGKTICPDFVLVRNEVRGVDCTQDFRNVLFGLMFAAIPSVNSLSSMYHFLERPLVQAELYKIQRRLGHDAFPVIAQSYFSSYREMMYGNAFPAVIKIGHAHAGQGKMQISSHRYLMTCDLLSP